MLSKIPLLDIPPSDDYEPSAQISWFVDKTDLIGKPVLYQLWQCVSIEVDRVKYPAQVWVKVPTEIRNKDA